ncbi:MAG: hypothetical protein WKF77_12275 [Planctomycetaceae bacterium]
MILASVFLAGCSGGESDAPNLVAANGTVLYKDQPIAGATVTFVVEKSPLATGTTNAEGKFTITTGGRPGAPLGNAKVGVSKAAPAVSAMGGEMKPEDLVKMSAESMKTGGAAVAEPEIPIKYGNPETSGLTAVLDADGSKNVFEFRLQD